MHKKKSQQTNVEEKVTTIGIHAAIAKISVINNVANVFKCYNCKLKCHQQVLQSH